jgi:hypothetical protein
MERIYIIKYRNGDVDVEYQKEFIYDKCFTDGKLAERVAYELSGQVAGAVWTEILEIVN